MKATHYQVTILCLRCGRLNSRAVLDDVDFLRRYPSPHPLALVADLVFRLDGLWSLVFHDVERGELYEVVRYHNNDGVWEPEPRPDQGG